MAKKETTTITVWKESVKKLEKRKTHHRQPIAEVVDMLLEGSK